jgi:hypothetical protein
MEAFSFTAKFQCVIPTKEGSHSFSAYVISPASMTKQQRLLVMEALFVYNTQND